MSVTSISTQRKYFSFIYRFICQVFHFFLIIMPHAVERERIITYLLLRTINCDLANGYVFANAIISLWYISHDKFLSYRPYCLQHLNKMGHYIATTFQGKLQCDICMIIIYCPIIALRLFKYQNVSTKAFGYTALVFPCLCQQWNVA